MFLFIPEISLLIKFLKFRYSYKINICILQYALLVYNILVF